MKIPRVLGIAGLVLAFLAGVVATFAVYETFFAPNVITYLNEPFPVVRDVVMPGESLEVLVEQCTRDTLNNNPLIYTFTRELVAVDSDARYYLPQGTGSSMPGCQTFVQSGFLIIPDVPPGMYYLRGATLARGQYKTTITDWQTVIFEISG